MKRVLNVFLICGISLILGLSFVSAGNFNNLWNKITGKGITDYCTDTCTSLEYQCGVGKICETIVECGTCSEGYNCIKGMCVNLSLIIPCYVNITPNNISRDCAIENKICLNGDCVISPTCVDSDGGLNYYTKGKVAYDYKDFSVILNDVSILEDYCSDNSVEETFCLIDSDEVAQFVRKTIECKYGCVNGACKRWYSSFFSLAEISE
jgi:hypothetical protein